MKVEDSCSSGVVLAGSCSCSLMEDQEDGGGCTLEDSSLVAVVVESWSSDCSC